LIDDATSDISEKYANKQMTALSFAKGSKTTIAVGGDLLLRTVTAPAKRTYKVFKWKSSNPDIVKVDSKGKIIGVKKGVAVITAVSQDFTDTIATIKVTVKNPSAGGSGGDEGGKDSSSGKGGGSGSSGGGDSVAGGNRSNGNTASSGPVTGDENPVALWFVLISLAAVILSGIVFYLRRTAEKADAPKPRVLSDNRFSLVP
jgi:hypothetical protein